MVCRLSVTAAASMRGGARHGPRHQACVAEHRALLEGVSTTVGIHDDTHAVAGSIGLLVCQRAAGTHRSQDVLHDGAAEDSRAQVVHRALQHRQVRQEQVVAPEVVLQHVSHVDGHPGSSQNSSQASWNTCTAGSRGGGRRWRSSRGGRG